MDKKEKHNKQTCKKAFCCECEYGDIGEEVYDEAAGAWINTADKQKGEND